SSFTDPALSLTCPLSLHDALPISFAAADHVPEILAFDPIGLEGFEGAIIDGLRWKGAPNLELMPEGRGFLLVEFGGDDPAEVDRSEEHTSELQSPYDLVCRLLLEK